MLHQDRKMRGIRIMKRTYQKSCVFMLGLSLCTLLTACKIGDHNVFEFYTDNNGEKHFMLVGKHNMQGPDSETMSEEQSDLTGETSSSKPQDADSETMVEESLELSSDAASNSTENAENPKSIVGKSLKRGWTSSDHSILKGKDVQVNEDSKLFSVDLGQEKEVTISYNIALEAGTYQLVQISPDGTKHVLCDSKNMQADETILFEQGKNEIYILSSDAVFKKINLSIEGIEMSDFM